MRIKPLIPLICVALLALPYASVPADPVLIWPESDFLSRESAGNLTAWFATQIGMEIDPIEDPQWVLLNETDLPDFIQQVRCTCSRSSTGGWRRSTRRQGS